MLKQNCSLQSFVVRSDAISDKLKTVVAEALEHNATLLHVRLLEFKMHVFQRCPLEIELSAGVEDSLLRNGEALQTWTSLQATGTQYLQGFRLLR